MNNENYELSKSLEIIGFSQKEVLVYLALLSLGKGTVSQIARKAGINRPSGYHVLTSLELKGFVKSSGKEPKQEYVANSPDEIEKFLLKKKDDYEIYIKEAKKIIPELKSMHNIENRPKISFYEGKDGLQKVYEDTLNSTGEILAYASVDDVHNTLPNYFPLYYKRRSKKGISIRAIFPDSPEARKLQQFDFQEKRNSILVPPDVFGFHPEINIYNDKIMIASWREKLDIVIESKEVSEAMKKVFELAWLGAKNLKNKTP
jgi:sugar-specific transcriptional regulator TrmB